ncbi:hypothetical protein PHYSODRAFT_289229 [Phytophthora sojae]|uniref:WLGC domain-containing protein n=1 Tax=Phytophthora sojae (strain P6497) TaxID=1094619 RepID=G5AFT7_PHYSP|nr:hypothetical protein PHYSODRAFT_289229 [Phytophthora sojae]EGZ05453.1 hypothetical protein PHYSODRAFT_289229 [Phytophthora sojae]|eukprot:XP_009538984.1 hypothetical protein PHYSODRAFT_289229 [Phytophthora sojae]
MESLQVIQDLAPLKHLLGFVIFSICPACCNGFLGACDTSDWFCTGNPELGTSASSCLGTDAPRPTAESQAVFQQFAVSMCIRTGFDIARVVDLLSKPQIDVCGGVPFRRCEHPPNSGAFGICMNNRLQVLTCVVNDDYVRLRQVEIERKLGPACDAVKEAWLGCSS